MPHRAAVTARFMPVDSALRFRSGVLRMRVSRREFLQLATAAGLGVVAAPRAYAARSAPEVYTGCLAIDGLGGPGDADSDEGAPLSAAAIADVKSSGLTAVHVTVGAVGTMSPLEAFEQIVRDVARWEGEIDRHPDVLARVRSASDIGAAKRNGRTGLIYGLQDGVSFEDDPGRLEALRHVGIRVIQPTYNRRNLLGDGCLEPADAGLSRTGHEAIERLNALGLLVDLSHCGHRTAAEAIAASRRPVAFTHTGCAALAEHPRHRSDAELKAVADKGGVIGIFVMPYLAKGRQPTAADVVAHLEHALEVAGEDHVSIGTDGTVSPTALTPKFVKQFAENNRKRRERGIAAPYETEEGYLFANDLNTPRRFETLAGLLLARGHGEARVEKVLGGNLARVFAEAWQPASGA
jgi:membrane dipeptidase